MSVHGKNSYVSIDASDVTTYCNASSLQRAIDNAEVTSFGDDDKAYIAGLHGATIPIGGRWHATLDGVMAGTIDSATVAWILGPAGSTSGLVRYTGNAFIANYNWSSTVGGAVVWTANFTVDGAITRDTF